MTTVQEIMTTRVIWVKKDATFREMAVALREHRVSAFPVVDDDLMYDRRVKRLPVTDADGRLVGIISRADVLSVFDRTDEAIRKEVTEGVLLGEFLTDPLIFSVTVKDGIVTLAGRPETSETGHEIVRRVRHLQGVVAVRDRLDYPPPERPADRYDVLANFPTD